MPPGETKSVCSFLKKWSIQPQPVLQQSDVLLINLLGENSIPALCFLTALAHANTQLKKHQYGKCYHIYKGYCWPEDRQQSVQHSFLTALLHKFIYSLLAVAIQPWTSSKVSILARLPSYAGTNLPPMSKRSPGLHNSFTANWLLLKEAPQGKQKGSWNINALNNFGKAPTPKATVIQLPPTF